MGKLVVSAHVTLDGVFQAPGASDEDARAGFPYGGWIQLVEDPQTATRINELVAASDALLLARHTYDIFATFWPSADPDDPITQKFNRQPKYVVSRTLKSPEWHNSRVLNGDLAAEVAKVKDAHDQVCVWGSGTLLPQLAEHDLIDEYLLFTYPVLLGTGTRLFAEALPRELHLKRAYATDAGVVVQHYDRIVPKRSTAGG